MKRDSFSCLHPAVHAFFFLAALGFGVVILHPAFLAAGIIGAFSYHLLLFGRGGIRRILMMLPLFLAVALLNPLINRNGTTILFSIFHIPYTLEALTYGIVLSGMFLNMILWFSCCSVVITGDKFSYLFGSLLPSLSLLLTMIIRLIPDLIRKGKQITGARASIGKAMNDNEGRLQVLSCLTSWALEGSIVTADSMRSRGYGAAKRTSFHIYRLTCRDRILLAVIAVLAAALTVSMATGDMTATFTPEWYIAPISPCSLVLYSLFSQIPTLLHLQEAWSWHISRSRI